MGLLAVEIIDLLIRPRRSVSIKAGYRAAVAILCLTAASLIPGILQLRRLQALGQLYYGGHTGLISDTIGSLLGTSSCGYGCTPTWLTTGEILVVLAAGLAVLWAIVRYVRKPTWCDVHRAALLFTVAILAVLLESWLLGALYPIDRTALDYVVLFGVLMIFFIDDLAGSLPPLPTRLLLCTTVGCFVVLATVNFARNANLTQTTIWAFDASSRQVTDTVLAFERRQGRPQTPWKLIAGFPRNEALNYYRVRLGMTWLQPVGREPISTPDGDLYYVGINELPGLPPDTTLLATFSDTDTQLRMGPALTNHKHP